MNKRPYNRSDWKERHFTGLRLRVSESDIAISRARIAEAVTNCETEKARATVRAKVFVDKLVLLK